MRIDLLKDRGILPPSHFVEMNESEPEVSEDELIAETLRRRHSGVHPEPGPEVEEPAKPDTPEVSTKPTRNPIRELFILLILLAVTAYYLHDRGVLIPSVEIIENYWLEVSGLQIDSPDTSVSDEEEAGDGVLSDDLFNQLMPVTDAIAALADSIATLNPDPLDTIKTSDSLNQYTPVAGEPIQLSDDDINIINNRSLLLMLTEFLNDIPDDMGSGHLLVKRDILSFTAPQGGEWVQEMKSTLDQFVLGSFTENYSHGNVKISSEFEIIMNAEQDFHVQVLDEMRLLDVLAHPFNKYLQQIILDLPRGVNDNPAKFTFSGNRREIQYILSSWAETRTNYLLRSVDIEFQSRQLILSFDVLFFNYSK